MTRSVPGPRAGEGGPAPRSLWGLEFCVPGQLRPLRGMPAVLPAFVFCRDKWALSKLAKGQVHQPAAGAVWPDRAWPVGKGHAPHGGGTAGLSLTWEPMHFHKLGFIPIFSSVSRRSVSEPCPHPLCG